MKHSEIRLSVELDDENIPDKIFWNATDNPSGKPIEEAKAVALSIWDNEKRETLRIDLWTKDMPVDDMKLMVIDTIGGLAETLRGSTNDEFMANEMFALCEKLSEHMKRQIQPKY